MAIDKYTGNDVVIDYNHYMVHDSQMYTASQYYTAAAAATVSFRANIGSLSSHALFDVQVSGQALVTLYEGITITASGTTCSVYNMNRESSNTCTSTFFYNSTFSTNTEIVLFQQVVPGGATVQTRVGAGSRTNTEWILSPSTKYLITVVNQAGATITASINIQFYEH